MNTTIKITITQSDEALLQLAISKGYVPEISEMNEEKELVMVPNPYTANDFLSNYFKNNIVDELSRFRIQEIRQTQEALMAAEINSEKEAIKEGVAVQIE